MLDNKPRPEGINNKVKCKQEMPSIKATNQQSLCVAYIAGHPQRLVPSIAAHPCLTPFLPPSLPTSLNPCTHSHMNKNGSTCNLADTVEEHGILEDPTRSRAHPPSRVATTAVTMVTPPKVRSMDSRPTPNNSWPACTIPGPIRGRHANARTHHQNQFALGKPPKLYTLPKIVGSVQQHHAMQ